MPDITDRPVKKWAVLIYIVADDPSGGELFDQIANRELDLITIGAGLADPRDRDMYVAVQIDFRTQPFVWRRIIRGGSWAQPESNAANPNTLYGFFDWASRECPADHYCLIL
jgi:hypothetical protein